MYDGPKIITGLVIFVALATLPFWFTAASGKGGATPDPKAPEGKECVESKEFMKAQHMDLLNEWRDDVVRNGNREYTAQKDGKKYDMSLTRTCMDCHDNKEQFCDECHNYVGVTPYCWECHIAPGKD
jgi:[DsrC]-trisulfide reductase subunit J